MLYTVLCAGGLERRHTRKFHECDATSRTRRLSWSLLGGRIALGKDSAATLVRELAEELHTNAHIDRLEATVERCNRGVDGTVFHELAFYYLIRLPDLAHADEPFIGPKVGFPAEFWRCPRSALGSIDIVPASIRSLIATLPSTYVHIHAHQAEYVLQRESFVQQTARHTLHR